MGQPKQSIKETLTDWYEAKVLCEHHVTNLRMLPSFRALIDAICDNEPEEALRLLDDDEYLITEGMPQFLTDLVKYQREFQFGIELLRAPQFQSSGVVGLRKPKRILLLEALQFPEGLSNSELVSWPGSLVHRLDVCGLSDLLDSLSQTTQQFKDVCGDARTNLKKWKERLKKLTNTDDDDDDDDEQMERKLSGMALPNADKKNVRRTETAKKAQTRAMDYLKQTGTEKTKLAMDIAEWISRTLKYGRDLELMSIRDRKEDWASLTYIDIAYDHIRPCLSMNLYTTQVQSYRRR